MNVPILTSSASTKSAEATPKRDSVSSLLEDLVAARILDLEGDGLLRDCLPGRHVQRQGAQVDHLARLIERLVRRQQQLVALGQVNRLRHLVIAGRRRT